jgi:hypothetical protein
MKRINRALITRIALGLGAIVSLALASGAGRAWN